MDDNSTVMSPNVIGRNIKLIEVRAADKGKDSEGQSRNNEADKDL